MDINEAPKMSLEEIVDKGLNPNAGVDTPEASAPQSEQQVVTREDGSDPAKTPSTEQAPETDKGFANHPKWMEREAKLKEAREQLQAKDQEAKRYAQLLDELQRQQQQVTKPVDKQAQALSIAEQVCKLKNWDISRLSADQRAIIDDQIELSLGVYEIQSKQQQAQLDQRLAPLEKAQHRWEQEQVMAQAQNRWAELSKEDGLDTKLVQAAIDKFCVEMDAKDPQRTIKLSDEDLYYRATRPLLREKEVSKVRQEARDTNMANARPLGKGPTSQVAEAPAKKQKTHDFLSDKLDALGIR